MDPHARPLRDALSPGAELLDSVAVGNMRVWWWKEVILDANWKVAQEVFHEGYHVMQTHPQLTMGAGRAYPPDGAEYTVFANGHAMVIPKPGRIWGGAAQAIASHNGRIRFAHGDASGLSLIEESVDRGVAAAESILGGLSVRSSSFRWNY